MKERQKNVQFKIIQLFLLRILSQIRIGIRIRTFKSDPYQNKSRSYPQHCCYRIQGEESFSGSKFWINFPYKIENYFGVEFLYRTIKNQICNMFAGHKVVCYCNITIFVVATPSRHRDLNIFRIFLVPEALLRWRVVVVALLLSHCCYRIVVFAKLKNCCVPSSANMNHRIVL